MMISKFRAALVALVAAATFNLAQASEHCDGQVIMDLGAGAHGTASVCFIPNRLKATFHVNNLVAGDAYTVWWVYFDDPSLCTNGPVEGTCGEGDLAPSAAGGGTPLGVFGRLGSAIAPRNGNVHINGKWGGMQPSSGAEIWLLMLSHGAANYADGRHLARQLLTPEDPLAGMPHLGNDVDGQGFIPVALTVHIVD
jgi:hypothetical protein